MLSTLFKLYVLLVFLLGFVSQIFPSPLVRSLDDFVFLALLIACIPRLKKIRGGVFWLTMFIPALLGFSLLWSLLLGNSAEVILLTVRQHKNAFLIFVLMGLSWNYLGFVLKVLRLCLIVSVPIAIYQFTTTTNWDEVTGVFGTSASGTLTLLILSYVFLEMSRRLQNREKILGLYIFIALPIFINETKISFLLIPYLFLIIFYVLGLLRPQQIIIGLVVFSALLFGANKLYVNQYNISLVDWFSADRLTEYMLAGKYSNVADSNNIDLGRFLRLEIAYDTLNKSETYITLFGNGLGSTFVGINSGLYGTFSKKFMNTGLNVGSRIQAYQMIVEFGFAGAASIILWMFFVFRKIRSFNQYSVADLFAIIMLSIVFVALFYQNVLIAREISFLLYLTIYTSLLQGRLDQYKVKQHFYGQIRPPRVLSG